MKKKSKMLSLSERWKKDRTVKKGSKKGNLISIPQCEQCANFIKTDALHCKQYVDARKPKCVLFTSKECELFQSANPLQAEIRDKQDEMLFGGYFGLIVGDALGVPVEFKPRFDRAKDPVEEMRAYGTYYQPFGTWSDDTSLTMCLAVSIAYDFSMDNIAQNFIDFVREGYMTPHGVVFDIGTTTKYAIERMAHGKNPVECGGCSDTDNGNGSLMRILPMAYYTKNMEPKERIQLIEEVSALTHGHKRSKLACIFYTQFAIELLKEAKREQAYENTIQFVKEYCAEEYNEELGHFEKVLNGKIAGLKEDDIRSTGYVVDTLEASIWAFLTTDNYRDCVLKAVNLGGDTDTIAAIAGGLAGIYYGFSSIPKNWVDLLAQKEVLYLIVQELREQE